MALDQELGIVKSYLCKRTLLALVSLTALIAVRVFLPLRHV